MPKGVYPRTKEHLKNLRQTNRKRMLGKHRSEKTKEKIKKGLWGDKSPNWRGGKSKCNGYTMIRSEKHPHALPHGHYVQEHRLVIEKKMGRYLTRDEQVHHLNGIKDDNREENLLLCNQKQHRIIEWKMINLMYLLIQEGRVIYDRTKENFVFINPLIMLRARIEKEKLPVDRGNITKQQAYNQAISDVLKIIEGL